MRFGSIALWMFVVLAAMTSSTHASGSSREAIVYAAKNWSDVQKAYRRLGGNADGVVAGAFVDKISELLDEQWTLVANLDQLAKRDRRFQMFVLRHLNEAVSADRATRIKQNAEQACPAEAKSLCKEISSRL